MSTPIAGVNSSVPTGGQAVTAVAAGPNGGFIVNPSNAADQGPSEVEDLFVNPVGSATVQGNGTTFRIPPGGSWQIIPGQSTPTSVNAASGGHKFSVVSY